MNVFITSLESVAVLLGIGLIGFWIIRKKIVPEQALGTLSPVALEIALPSLIFVNIIEGFSPADYPQWWLLPVYWLIFTGIAAGLTAVCMFVSHKETRKEFAMSLFYQNGIFFPLAILAGLYPTEPSYLVSLFLFTLFYPAFFFNTYQLFSKRKSSQIHLRKIIHPVLIITCIAVIIRYAQVQSYIPSVVIEILRLLGGMTVPLIMLILGGNIYLDFKKKGTVYSTEIMKFVMIKNIVFPLVFLAIIISLKPEKIIALLLLLQSVVPPVTAVPLMVERIGGNRAVVNQFVVASFLSSLVTIPVMITLFSLYY